MCAPLLSQLEKIEQTKFLPKMSSCRNSLDESPGKDIGIPPWTTLPSPFPTTPSDVSVFAAIFTVHAEACHRIHFSSALPNRTELLQDLA